MIDDTALLALWERSVGLPPWRRDDALLAATGAAVPTALGARNAALLGLHDGCFGPQLALLSNCPACGTATEFEADVHTLLQGLDVPSPGRPQRVELQGYAIEFTLPQRDDIEWAAAVPEAFDERLLQRCIVAQPVDGAMAAGLPEPVRVALAQHMETLDPGASLCFELACPACAERWVAPLDVGHLLWSRLQAVAEALLLEVDALARVYGWTEPEVLALGPVRRAAYLQLAAA